MLADCAILSVDEPPVGAGCANGTKNKTRRLKPRLHKQSPPSRTQEGVLKPDFGIKSHINGLGFRSLTNDYCQLSTVNCQLSTVNCQLSSTVNCQLLKCFQSFGC
jgi:hypothetical protein